MTYSKIPLQLGIEDGCKHILEKDKNCVVVLADMGLCIFSEEFMDYYADRIFQIGIAEQNAIAICGGMAAAGLHPIFITFASFLVRRGLDQIINSVLVPKFPVILIGIRSGLSEAGGISHCIVNDIGILKALPNIEIYEASSFVQLKNILFLVYSKNAPAYIRVSDEFNNNYSILGDYAVRSKGSEIIKEGIDGVILTYGKMVSRALKVRKIFLKEKISLGVVNLYSIYPMGAVAKTPAEAQNVDTELIDEAKPAFMAYAEAIEFYTDHAAGLNGHAGRGADLVNSANFGYDQTVQMYADGNALFLQQGNWAYSNIAKVDEAVAERSSFIPLKMPFTDSMMLNGRSAEQLNSSIIVTTGNYYAINAKVSEKQQEYAVEFLKWMMKPENVEKYIVGEFKFIPYNVTEDMELDNALSTSIQSYMGEGNVINDTVVGTPKTWSGEKVGTALLEKYLRQEEWDDSTIESIGELCVDSWKELKTN